jgi:transposase
MGGLFWLTKAQMRLISPNFPLSHGVARVDDRRVVSGIVHVLKSGSRWVDAPPDYGSKKTLYNRFVRWAEKGVWTNLFQALAQAGGPSGQVLIDSSAVKAHRSAAGGKAGRKIRPSAARVAGARPDPCADRCSMPSARFHADRRPSRGLYRCRSAARPSSRLRCPARGQRLRRQRDPSTGRRTRRDAEHPAQGQSQMEALLLAIPLPKPKRDRADVLQAERLSARRHSLRSKRHKLPRGRLHRGRHQLLLMSLT